MTHQSTARARVFDIPEPLPQIFPLQFEGCARLALDREAIANRVADDMWRAARTGQVADDRMRVYAGERGIPHPKFEAAVLAEAFKLVSVEKLIDRVTDDLAQRLPATLETRYSLRAEQSGDVLLLKVGAESYGDPKYVIVGDHPAWSVIPGFSNAAGRLSLVGSLIGRRGEPLTIDAGWPVKPGITCAWFGRNAGACFAQPVRTVVGCLAADALSRFSRALPGELSRLLAEAPDPTFVNVERLLRLGRLTHGTRVYLLYWKRLRDYLIWSAIG